VSRAVIGLERCRVYRDDGALDCRLFHGSAYSVRCDCARCVVAPKNRRCDNLKINSVQQHHTALVIVAEIVRILGDS
jgi:hypothetical protein